MGKYTTIIVDDEENAAMGVHALLSSVEQLKVVAICRNGLEAIKAIKQHRPQLVFLDIQMPQVNGLEVLATLQAEEVPLPIIVFVTAFDQYSIKAFEFHAVDYILKPFTDERFYQAVDHATSVLEKDELLAEAEKLRNLGRAFAQSQKGSSSLIEAPANETLTIKSDGKIIFLHYPDILWLQAYDYYIRIHVAERFYLVRESLKKMEQKLPENQFFRVHKSAIIHKRYIKSIENQSSGDVLFTLASGTEVKGSRNYRARIQQLLK